MGQNSRVYISGPGGAMTYCSKLGKDLRPFHTIRHNRNKRAVYPKSILDINQVLKSAFVLMTQQP